MWKKCLDCIDELLDILFEHSNIFIGENIAEDSETLGISDQVTFHLYSFLLYICGSFRWQLDLENVQLKAAQSPLFLC